MVLATYDAAGNVLETASSSSLLALSVLPDNRQEISFRTTRNFAQAGFVAVGQVAAAGSSAGPRRYTLRDAAAPTRATSYYRLRQVDTDGTETLSLVVALAALDGAGAGFTLYPNPAPDGAVTLSFDGPVAEGTTAVIYSPVGQVLRRQPVRAAAEQPATVSTAGLPAGIYHVVLRDAAGQPLGTQRLVVSN